MFGLGRSNSKWLQILFTALQDEHFLNNIFMIPCLVMNTVVDQNEGLFDVSMFQVLLVRDHQYLVLCRKLMSDYSVRHYVIYVVLSGC